MEITGNIVTCGSMAANITPKGLGGSSWSLIKKASFEVATSSTTAENIGTVECGSEAFTKYAAIWIRIRGRKGKAAGSFYGSDSIIVNSNKANGATSAFSNVAVVYTRTNANGSYYTNWGQYGVYAYSITSGGAVTIRSRYSANTLTIDDTYDVEVYKLNMPDGRPLFT